jgi:hypothetical protein
MFDESFVGQLEARYIAVDFLFKNFAANALSGGLICNAKQDGIS